MLVGKGNANLKIGKNALHPVLALVLQKYKIIDKEKVACG